MLLFVSAKVAAKPRFASAMVKCLTSSADAEEAPAAAAFSPAEAGDD